MQPARIADRQTRNTAAVQHGPGASRARLHARDIVFAQLPGRGGCLASHFTPVAASLHPLPTLSVPFAHPRLLRSLSRSLAHTRPSSATRGLRGTECTPIQCPRSTACRSKGTLFFDTRLLAHTDTKLQDPLLWTQAGRDHHLQHPSHPNRRLERLRQNCTMLPRSPTPPHVTLDWLTRPARPSSNVSNMQPPANSRPTARRAAPLSTIQS